METALFSRPLFFCFGGTWLMAESETPGSLVVPGGPVWACHLL